jgi:uncharacterized membrane protein
MRGKKGKPMSFVTLDQATRAATTAPLVDGTQAATRVRVESVDLLRGVVMVLMALDHTRDFFGASGMNPRDVAEPALFLTRWITHFCAPLFIFLAGTSAYLYGARGRTTAELSRFLFTRGFWLIVIEFTLVRFAWSFDLDLGVFVLRVLWAIGASMVVLSGLIYLPRWAILAIGLAMIAGHHLLDSIRAENLGAAGAMWSVLHQPGPVTSTTHLFVRYPLIPCVGVMAAGYALGPVFALKQHVRVRLLAGLGAAITVGFVLIRAANSYGDPAPWSVQPTLLATVLSFVNCEKYPFSLLFLMMTLGPGLVLLAAFEGVRGRLADIVATFGRVPFFYYVTHLYLIHLLAIPFALIAMGDAAWLFGDVMFARKPHGYGLGLVGVYAVWLFVVVALYWPCRWFAAVKQRRTDWWLSYL